MPQLAASEIRPGMVVRHQHFGDKPILVWDVNRGVTHSHVIPAKVGVWTAQTPYQNMFPNGEQLEVIEDRTEAIKNFDKQKVMETSASGLSTTIGSDPEIFCVDKQGDVIPAWEYLPDKENQLLISGTLYNGSGTFYDGFQAEWTTPAEVGCLGFLTDHIYHGMSRVLYEARKKNPDAKLSYKSVIDIPESVAARTPRERWALGCSPSKNVYNEHPLQVESPHLLPFRFAGWHMHFRPTITNNGTDRFENPRLFAITPPMAKRAVRMLDKVLGVASVSFGASFTDRRRREYYGRAGEYRLGKTLEYRVPDVIIGAHPATFNLLWDIARKAMILGFKDMEFIWDSDDAETRGTINEYDVISARKILKRNEQVFKYIMHSTYGDTPPIRHGWNVIYNGIESVIADPTNLEHNWYLSPGRLGTWGFETGNPRKNPDQRWGSFSYVLEGAK